jgi:hypothetical protein
LDELLDFGLLGGRKLVHGHDVIDCVLHQREVDRVSNNRREPRKEG